MLVARDWADQLSNSSAWLFISGAVGRGKTGLAASVAQQFLAADPQRAAFVGRVSPAREELAGEHGAILGS
jgi:chromosomal replication initiation ATPase DnaA